MTCEWCGHEHAREALCTKRPTWSRRGFIALFGAGLAGLALPGIPLSPPPTVWEWEKVAIRLGMSAQDRGVMKYFLATYNIEGVVDKLATGRPLELSDFAFAAAP